MESKVVVELSLGADKSNLLRVRLLLDACKLLTYIMVMMERRGGGVGRELGEGGGGGAAVWRLGLLTQVISTHVIIERSVGT